MREVWSASELRASGVTERALARSVAAGEIRRIRRDHYCDPSTHPDVIESVRIGGRVGCVSLLALSGVWVTRCEGLHVRIPPNGSRLRRGSARLHWSPTVDEGTRSRVSVLDALLDAMLCLSFLDAVASVDSALHLGLLTLTELRPHCTDPVRARVLRWADGRAESGVESILRVVLRLAGLRVDVQVRITGVGRVDLVVERCVVVEVDGAAYHAGARRHVDHQRDAVVASRGLTPLRFNAAQVLYELASVVDAIIAAVRTHRGARFSGRQVMATRNRAFRALRA